MKKRNFISFFHSHDHSLLGREVKNLSINSIFSDYLKKINMTENFTI